MVQVFRIDLGALKLGPAFFLDSGKSSLDSVGAMLRFHLQPGEFATCQC